MAIVDQLIAILGYDLRDRGELRKWKKGLDDAERGAGRVGQAIQAQERRIVAAAARMGAVIGTAIGAGISAVGVGAIKTTAQFESFRATLTTIEGDSAKAQQSLDWIAKFARTTPYEMKEVTDAFIKMKAYGLDPADGSLKALGDVASAMGKPMMQAVEAMADATTFEFERLKEFGVRAAQQGDQVTFTWTENGKQLSKTVKKNSEEVSRFLIGNFRRFEGAMDLQSRTWNGLVSNLSDTWTDFLRRVGEAGVFDFAKSRLEGFMARLDQWDKDGTIDRWAKRFSGAFEGILKGVEWFATSVAYHLDYIFETIAKGDTSKLWWLAAGLAAVVFALSPWSRAFAGIAAVLDDVLGYLEGRPSKFGDFVAWLRDMTGASEGLAEALAGVAFALGLLVFIRPMGFIRLLGRLVGAAGGYATVNLMAAAIRSLAGAMGMLGGMGILRMLGKGSMYAMIATLLGMGIESGLNPEGKSAQPGDVLPNGTIMTDDNDGRDAAADDYLLGPPVRQPGGTVTYPAAPQGYSPEFIDPNGLDGALQQLGAIFSNFMNASAATEPAAAQQAVTEDNRVQSDQRNQSTTVTVGGVKVEVMSPDAAPAATGAAVGRAVGNAASGATPPAARNESPILQ